MVRSEKISVVVPIYNVEEYLVHCLDSILSQTYSNIEVMLVDDGSPDGSGAICDEYAAKDSRIRVFHIPNGGVAAARQLGVENSEGDYIVFVDPDDWLPLNSIETLYGAIDNDVDIIVGNFVMSYGSKLVSNKQQNRQLSGVEYLKIFLRSEVSSAPWAKLFRKSLFTALSFPNVRRQQDKLMNIDVACRARGVKILPTSVYYYRGSTTNSTLNSFKGGWEYYTNLLRLISDTLHREGRFDTVRDEFDIATLNSYFDIIKECSAIEQGAQEIKELKKRLRGVHLSKYERLMLMTLTSSMMQRVVAYLFRLMRGNKNLWIRKIVKSITKS